MMDPVAIDNERGTVMEKQVTSLSEAVWEALSNEDMDRVRELVDERAIFVHMGMTVDREGEIAAYESGHIKPGPVEFKSRDVRVFDNTAICETDVNVTAYVQGKEAIHHFAVTETYAQAGGSWKLVAFVFTALVY